MKEDNTKPQFTEHLNTKPAKSKPSKEVSKGLDDAISAELSKSVNIMKDKK